MTEAFAPLQAAIFSALNGNAKLNGVAIPIYDGLAPESTPDPFVLIGETSGVDWMTKSGNGMDCTATILVWSQALSMLEAEQIMSAVEGLLMPPAVLSVAGFTISAVPELQHAEVLVDPAGKVRHGIIQIRYRLVEEVLLQGYKQNLYVNTGSEGSPVWTLLKGQTTCRFNLKSVTPRVTTHQSGGWDENISGISSWFITSSGYEVAGDVALAAIMSASVTGIKLHVQWRNSTTTVYDGFALANLFDSTASMKDSTAVAVTLIGTGALTAAMP
jgi:predicted secreted protein